MSKPILSRAILLAIGACAIVAVALLPIPALATNEADVGDLKKLIFEDCAAAGQLVDQTSAEDSPTTLAYLLRVVELELGGVATVVPGLPQQNAFGAFVVDSMLGGELVQFQDVQRESEARRCALSLLVRFGESSAQALPRLLALLGDERRFRLDPEYRKEVSRTLLRLQRRILEHREWSLPFDVVKALLERVPRYQSSDVRQFIVELGERVVDTLISMIGSSNVALRNDIFEILCLIDPEGTLVGEPILRLIGVGDDNIREEVISYALMLPAIRSELFILAIDRLFDVSPHVRKAALKAVSTIPALGVPKVNLDLEHSQRLLEAFSREGVDGRRSLAPAFLLAELDIEETKRVLLPLMRGEEGDELRADAIALMARVAGEDKELARIVREGVRADGALVRLACVRSLPFVALAKKEKLNLLLEIGKDARRRDAIEKADLLVAMAEAAEALYLDQKEQPPLAVGKSLLEVLGAISFASSSTSLFPRSDNIPAPLTVLATFDGEIEKQLANKLGSPQALVREQVAWILGLMSAPKISSLAALVSLLKDSERSVRERAEWALARHPDGSKKLLESALEWQPVDARLGAARLLAEMSPDLEGIVPVLLEGINTKPCPVVIELVSLLRKISDADNESVDKILIACLLRHGDFNRREIVTLLVDGGRLSDGNRQTLLSVIRSSPIDPELLLKLLSESEALGLPVGEVVGLLLELLDVSEESLKLRIIELLGRLGIGAHEAKGRLVGFAEREEENYLIRSEAVVALSFIDPQAIDMRSFFARALRPSTRRGSAVSALGRMPPDLVVPLLGSLMHQERLQDRIIAYDAVSELGNIAKAAIPVLLENFADSSGDEARAIFRALVRMSSESPEVESIILNIAKGRKVSSSVLSGAEGRVLEILPRILGSRSDAEDRTALLQLAEELQTNLKIERATNSHE